MRIRFSEKIVYTVFLLLISSLTYAAEPAGAVNGLQDNNRRGCCGRIWQRISNSGYLQPDCFRLKKSAVVGALQYAAVMGMCLSSRNLIKMVVIPVLPAGVVAKFNYEGMAVSRNVYKILCYANAAELTSWIGSGIGIWLDWSTFNASVLGTACGLGGLFAGGLIATKVLGPDYINPEADPGDAESGHAAEESKDYSDQNPSSTQVELNQAAEEA